MFGGQGKRAETTADLEAKAVAERNARTLAEIDRFASAVVAAGGEYSAVIKGICATRTDPVTRFTALVDYAHRVELRFHGEDQAKRRAENRVQHFQNELERLESREKQRLNQIADLQKLIDERFAVEAKLHQRILELMKTLEAAHLPLPPAS